MIKVILIIIIINVISKGSIITKHIPTQLKENSFKVKYDSLNYSQDTNRLNPDDIRTVTKTKSLAFQC